MEGNPMQVKVFWDHIQHIEPEINKWLEENDNVVIRLISQSPLGADHLVVIIAYDSLRLKKRSQPEH